VKSVSAASLALFAILVAADAAGAEDEIRQVLNRQAADWNRGDVDAFMNGYDESVVFVGSALTRGRQQVLESYRKRYSTREKMGTLQFSGLEIRLLGGDHAFVLGQWNLQRKPDAGGDAGGWFTLLFRRTSAGWRIVHDHTSTRAR
jgi:uncharacterized protein (TIGR02246 family)